MGTREVLLQVNQVLQASLQIDYPSVNWCMHGTACPHASACLLAFPTMQQLPRGFHGEQPSPLYSAGSSRLVQVCAQGFNWECSQRKDPAWYGILASRAAEMKAAGITAVWLPPPSASVSTEVCEVSLCRIPEAAIISTTFSVAMLACQNLSIDRDPHLLSTPRKQLGEHAPHV